MNRRDFLQTGAAATVTATQAMSARSYASILGANDRVGLGVIGLGRRATIVCAAHSRSIRAWSFAHSR